MPPRKLKIISGGQTGVDRGALDAALAAGAECGGWCPAGRLAEDGRIPERYPLREVDGGYAERTAHNVADSEGTLVICFGEPEGGTRATINNCVRRRKPYCVIDALEGETGRAVEIARAFVQQHAIGTLNVAGPRASEAPAAYEYARGVVTGLLLAG